VLLSISTGFRGTAGNSYTFKCCISCTNIFFTDIFVKAKLLSNIDQAAHQNMANSAAVYSLHCSFKKETLKRTAVRQSKAQLP